MFILVLLTPSLDKPFERAMPKPKVEQPLPKDLNDSQDDGIDDAEPKKPKHRIDIHFH